MKNIPKLRFPEFVNDGEWEEKKLGHKDICYSISSGKDKNDSNGIFDLYGSTGIIGKSLSDSHIGNFILVARVGANAGFLTKASGKFGVTDNTLVLDLHEEVSIDFVFSLLEKFGLNKLIFGSGQPLITGRQLKELSLFFPKPNEQQKIADCLSSVDGLISAQSQKIELLKEHKKGLMQQLFPSNHPALSGTPPKEGNVPKRRFPEFVNDGEWEEKKLGDIGKVSMCKRIMKDETTENGDIPFYKIGTFGKQADAYINKELYEEYKNKYSFPKKGDILISASGTIGRLVVYDGLPAYFQDSNIVWIDNNEKFINNSFLSFFYETIKWTTEDTTIARLYNDNLRSIQILVPKPKEQQKIADCLSSLDEQINQQTSKLQTLKEHKKGLMQQLFPSSEA